MITKILIVDDHSFTRAGIKAIVETSNSNYMVGEAINGNDAIKKVREKQPDIVIMDINMPGLTGMEATKIIMSEYNTVKIIALSMHSGENFVNEMLHAGAVAYLLKEDAPEELLTAIKKVVHGEMYLSSAVTRTALNKNIESKDLNVLETKLYRPIIRDDYITRKNIIDKLEKNVTNPLSIISAAAGYGKSVVVSDWLERTSYLNTWISLDTGHNDFRIFLVYLIASIEKIFPGAMISSSNILNSGDLPPSNDILTSFINEICNINEDFILVLDDFHVIREEKIQKFFDEWLLYPPPNVHLSIITRRDPPLNIKKLENSGQITEIRMEDLSLSNDEVDELFKNLLSFELNDKTIGKLLDKTEGWIIGLRLASLALQKEEDVDRLLNALDGSINAVSEFLISEVLMKLPKNILGSILESSVLNRFCSDLLDTICTDKSKSDQNNVGEDLIQWLIQSNMFLISMDVSQKWFRYHHMFQQLLQIELIKQRTTKQINEIHSLASKWFKNNNYIGDAIEHSLKAQNGEGAITIIEENWEDTFDKGDWHIVEEWMTLIPEEDLIQSVNLLCVQLWILQRRHLVEEVTTIVSLIEQRKVELTDKEIGYLDFAKSTIHLFAGDIQKALAYAEQALQLIPKTHYIFRGATYALWTVALQMIGRGEEAVRSAKEALKNIDSPDELEELAHRRMHLNYIYMVNADLKLVKQNLEAFFALPNSSPYMLAFGWYFEASTYWWSYDQEGAIREFERVISYKYRCRPRIVIEAYICKAIVLQELKRTTEANKTIQKGIQFAEHTKDQVNINIINSGQIRVKLIQGELGTAEKWLMTTKHNKLDFSMQWWVEVSSITRCRVLIAMNTSESLSQAIDLLEEHRIYVESIFNKLRTIEVLVFQARAFLKLKRVTDAREKLNDALNLAIDHQFIRPFIEEGVDLQDLLLQQKKQGIRIKFIELILSRIKNNTDIPIQDLADQKEVIDQKHREQYMAFTRKEMEILHCVSEGLRNIEIADKLFNSEQTIKKHLSNMFQKLQVGSRLKLVAKARELGILE